MELTEQLYQILKKTCEECTAESISLSGGLDSSILAYLLKDRKPNAVAIIISEFIASDLTYCQLVANKFELPLTIQQIPVNELLDGVEETIKILKNFNDIEIRNQVTAYFAIKWAKSNGFNSIITGDGADELFAGYTFLLKKSMPELDIERTRILNVMDFPSVKLAKELGIKIETPYIHNDVQEFVKKIPSNLLVHELNGQMIGKWILRKTFDGKIPNSVLWRKKVPMQDGSGTSGLTEFFDKIISDEVFAEKSKNIKEKDNVEIRTKESLYYYEIFRKHNKLNQHNSNDMCPYCKSDILQNSKFCKICGAYPI